MSAGLLETPLEKLARVLSQEYHVDVVLEGERAHIRGKTIVLPAYSDVSDELMDKLGVMLDREVGHVLYTTIADLPGTDIEKALGQVLEDARVEFLMSERYPGMRRRFQETWLELYAGLCGGLVPMSQAVVGAIGTLERGLKVSLSGELGSYVDLVGDLIGRARVARSSAEVAQIARQMARRLRLEEKECQSENGKKENAEATGENSSAEGDEDKEKENADAQDKNTGKKKGKEAKKNDDRKEDGEHEADEKEADDEREKPVNCGEPTADDSHVGTETVTPRGPSARALEEVDEKVFDLTDRINRELGDLSRRKGESGNVPMLPLTTRFDVVLDRTKDAKPGSAAKLREAAMPLVLPVERGLERVLKVREHARMAIEQERGKVSPRTLTRLVTQPGERKIFQQFVKHESPKVAVEILVDLSGSMSANNRIHEARMASYVLSLALTRLHVPVEVTGFMCEYSAGMNGMAGVYRRGYTGLQRQFVRWSERAVYSVFKHFDDPRSEGINFMQAGSNNHDGEAVLWAARRLAARRERRKVLFVLSDGEPLAADQGSRKLEEHLRQVIRGVTDSGIECVGVGIQTAHVERLYPDWVEVRDVQLLGEVVLGTMSKLLQR